MKLTEQQIKIIEAKLKAHKIKCPICNETKYSLSDRVFQLEDYQQAGQANYSLDYGTLVFPSPLKALFPVVTVICGECGHLEFFSALSLGVVKSETKRYGWE